jgi:hypothetical protein
MLDHPGVSVRLLPVREAQPQDHQDEQEARKSQTRHWLGVFAQLDHKGQTATPNSSR